MRLSLAGGAAYGGEPAAIIPVRLVDRLAPLELPAGKVAPGSGHQGKCASIAVVADAPDVQRRGQRFTEAAHRGEAVSRRTVTTLRAVARELRRSIPSNRMRSSPQRKVSPSTTLQPEKVEVAWVLPGRAVNREVAMPAATSQAKAKREKIRRSCVGPLSMCKADRDDVRCDLAARTGAGHTLDVDFLRRAWNA